MKPKNYKTVAISTDTWNKIEALDQRLSIGDVADYLIKSGLERERMKLIIAKEQEVEKQIQIERNKKFPRNLWIAAKRMFRMEHKRGIA